MLIVKNHTNFAFTKYEQNEGKFPLGTIVKKFDTDNNKWEIGVIIQNHDLNEFRVDTWGNCHKSEVRIATLKDVKLLAPKLIEHLTKDIPLFEWSK